MARNKMGSPKPEQKTATVKKNNFVGESLATFGKNNKENTREQKNLTPSANAYMDIQS